VADLSIRHILPGFGYFPDDPRRSPMSGIATVVYNLAREAAQAGSSVAITGFSNRSDRMRSVVDGIAVERVRHRALLSLPRIDLSYAGPIAWLGIRHRVDIAHVHSNPYLLRPLRASCRILHYHAADFPALGAYRRAAGRADAIIFCSRFLRDYFLDVVGDVGRPLHVVPNGVAVERFRDQEGAGQSFRRRLGIGDDEFVVLFVGNVCHEKGTHVLVEAVERARVREEGPIRLVVVGNSMIWQRAGHAPAMTTYEETLWRRADPAIVSFPGALSPEEMPAAYAASDLVACPSLCADAAPVVLREAMAAGKPVVGSRIGGITEAIEERETGFIVDPDDPAALASVIERCSADREQCRALGAQSRRRAVRYSWEVIAEEIAKIYTQALGSSNGSS
jgi:glycosyltransferase involved in cell wall biosynthesis